ncbi:hypothetical protein [Mycoplasma sp. Ms02]|uniref:hypothetical protein n=1 Tax=Mycoplasma sp. Ms02 TaxID=353851 RepID=UPI001C8A170D|nr:hypothetical protein [Mycoplasma sp. Ms02]QZE12410.1 hypothetical protein K4L35_00240 [Mycoplasma sp. Ms02]
MEKEIKIKNQPNEPQNQTSWQKARKSIKIKRVTTLDIVIAGILLSLYLLVVYLKNYTVFTFFKVNTEFIFNILMGAFLGPIFGPITAALADTLGLVVAGNIGSWYWAFAITPVLITFTSKIFFKFLFKKDNKSLYFMIAASYAALMLATIVITKQIAISIEEEKQITLARIFNFNKVPRSFVLVALIASYVVLTSLIILVVLPNRNNQKTQEYFKIFFLILFLVVVFNWIYGPYRYINFYNYRLSHGILKKGALKNYGSDYLLWMSNYLIKSLITIPIYTVIMVSLLYPIKHFQKHFDTIRINAF